MRNKNILLLMFAGLLIILIMQNVFAIGITPGRTTLNFEPGLHKEISFSVVNSEHKDMSVVFSVRGDLEDSITLSQTSAEFSVSDNSKSFTYVIDLPQEIGEPGMYETEIIVLEVPEDSFEEGTSVGATVAVATQLHVHVPYPDKYVEMEVNVIESGKNNEVIFLVPVINRGKLDVNNLKAVIDIYTSSNEKIETIESESESLKSLERKELVVDWSAEVDSGIYRAVVKVEYDGEITQKEIEFNVGDMAMEVKEITINDFELGGIAKFNALVVNNWMTDLKNVYLNILVYNYIGEVMADFKSQTYDIDSLSEITMVAYWDTEGVEVGTYDGDVILKYGKYGEKSIEKSVQIKVEDYSIEVLGLTGRVITKKGGMFNLNNLLIVSVILLIIGNIIWFFIVRRLKKKK